MKKKTIYNQIRRSLFPNHHSDQRKNHIYNPFKQTSSVNFLIFNNFNVLIQKKTNILIYF